MCLLRFINVEYVLDSFKLHKNAKVQIMFLGQDCCVSQRRGIILMTAEYKMRKK